MKGRTTRGYVYLVVSYLLIGLSGTMVAWATAPESALLVMRYAIAAVILGLVFARLRPLAGVLRRDLWPRLLLMGALDAVTILAYFFAIRSTGVAIATFLLFMQPVWVAFLAPRLLKAPTEGVVFIALGVALSGLVVILAPSLIGGAVGVSAVGVAIGLFAGWGYAGFQLLTKDLTRSVPSYTLVIVETSLDCLFLLPLALSQTLVAGHGLTGRDLMAGLILGVVCTAIAYAMWMEGLARVRVQHSSVLGFLTPAAAPVYALVLLGQSIGSWTLLGGVLILAAGLLVVLFGRQEPKPEPPL